MPLTHGDVRRILDILDSATHLDSLDVTVGDFELHARKPGAAAPALQPGPAMHSMQHPAATPAARPGVVDAAPGSPVEVPAGLVAVRSPMVGTFYLRPSPDQPPFVAVGSVVAAGDTVCLVEVMKMFNTVKAGIAGTIERILVSDGKPVQHEQAMLFIRPAAGA